MSNTMTAHEPIHYLDSILNEEEKRCEYSHQWRNFTISRSGRFKSKNKNRDVVDGKFFDVGSTTKMTAATATTTKSTTVDIFSKEGAIINSHMAGKQEWHSSFQHSTTSKLKEQASMGSGNGASNIHNGKVESYKSFYETNL